MLLGGDRRHQVRRGQRRFSPAAADSTPPSTATTPTSECCSTTECTGLAHTRAADQSLQLARGQRLVLTQTRVEHRVVPVDRQRAAGALPYCHRARVAPGATRDLGGDVEGDLGGAGRDRRGPRRANVCERQSGEVQAVRVSPSACAAAFGRSVSPAASPRCCLDQLSRNARVSLTASASVGGVLDTADGANVRAALVWASPAGPEARPCTMS